MRMIMIMKWKDTCWQVYYLVIIGGGFLSKINEYCDYKILIDFVVNISVSAILINMQHRNFSGFKNAGIFLTVTVTGVLSF